VRWGSPPSQSPPARQPTANPTIPEVPPSSALGSSRRRGRAAKRGLWGHHFAIRRKHTHLCTQIERERGAQDARDIRTPLPSGDRWCHNNRGAGHVFFKAQSEVKLWPGAHDLARLGHAKPPLYQSLCGPALVLVRTSITPVRWRCKVRRIPSTPESHPWLAGVAARTHGHVQAWAVLKAELCRSSLAIHGPRM
jgi:hypothetical protein